MAALTVGCIDPFHPKTVEAIAAVLPQDWRLSVTTGPAPEERAAALSDAEVLFVMATPVPAALLAAAPRLRFIQKLGSGVYRIELDVCRERGIGFARPQAGHAIPVAAHNLLPLTPARQRLTPLAPPSPPPPLPHAAAPG